MRWHERGALGHPTEGLSPPRLALRCSPLTWALGALLPLTRTGVYRWFVAGPSGGSLASPPCSSVSSVLQAAVRSGALGRPLRPGHV